MIMGDDVFTKIRTEVRYGTGGALDTELSTIAESLVLDELWFSCARALRPASVIVTGIKTGDGE